MTRFLDSLAGTLAGLLLGVVLVGAIARAYGRTRTGQYGGPDNVTVRDLFVIQSKAGGWFSERVWAELVKLPRSGGRIPTLVVSDRPGPGHPTRRYVVRMLADDLDLHGPDAA